MPVGRNLGNNAIELRREAHVQHPIGFVQHQNLEIVENDVLPFHVIEQSSRSRDDDIHSGAQRLRLGLEADTPRWERRQLRVLRTAEAFLDCAPVRRRSQTGREPVNRRPLSR